MSLVHAHISDYIMEYNIYVHIYYEWRIYLLDI